jgi:hypothetical protein
MPGVSRDLHDLVREFAVEEAYRRDASPWGIEVFRSTASLPKYGPRWSRRSQRSALL